MLKLTIQHDFPIVLDVQLQCDRGEVLALVGPSGAGKSTVLRAIAGLQMVTQGRIECNDNVWFDSDKGLALTPQQRRVGIVFQDYALFPHLSVIENVLLACDKGESKQLVQFAESLIKKVNLSGLEQRYPDQLSGGQRQRVALARALARNPDVLLLDEPFSAVDKVTRRKLYLELNSLRRELDMPVILVTHDLDEAAMLADKLCVIHHGKTLQQGDVERVLQQPDNISVAKQVDAINVFEGQLKDDNGTLKLEWHGHQFDVSSAAGFEAGELVDWLISPAKILLHQRLRPSNGDRENPVSVIIREMLTLRGVTTLLLALESQPTVRLQMNLPEHVVHRNQLSINETIEVSLLSEAFHLMKRQ
jgi:molybdate transport system ATP-binding protein